MTPFYLKFPSQQAASDALIAAFGSEKNDSGATVFIAAGPHHFIDVLGVVFSNGVPESGCNVNLMADVLPAALSAFQIFPSTPSRVFQDAALKFYIYPDGSYHEVVDYESIPSGSVEVTKRPSTLKAWNGSVWIDDAAAIAKADQADADNAAILAAKADATIAYLVSHTPAQCYTKVQTDVTDLASAKVMLGRLAMAISVLARWQLR